MCERMCVCMHIFVEREELYNLTFVNLFLIHYEGKLILKES